MFFTKNVSRETTSQSRSRQQKAGTNKLSQNTKYHPDRAKESLIFVNRAFAELVLEQGEGLRACPESAKARWRGVTVLRWFPRNYLKIARRVATMGGLLPGEFASNNRWAQSIITRPSLCMGADSVRSTWPDAPLAGAGWCGNERIASSRLFA